MSKFYDNMGNWSPIWEKGKKCQVRVYDIEWDTDGVDPKSVSLPSEVKVIVNLVNGDDLGDIISDFLSDEYGYCHYGFEYDTFDETSFDYRAGENSEIYLND